METCSHFGKQGAPHLQLKVDDLLLIETHLVQSVDASVLLSEPNPFAFLEFGKLKQIRKIFGRLFFIWFTLYLCGIACTK